MAEGRHAAYVRRVQEDARRCAESILADNERLRKQLAVLETSRNELERRFRKAEEAARLTEPLRALAASLEAEKLRLQQRVAELESELQQFQEASAALERQLAEAEARSRLAVEEYSEIQRRSTNLTSLYVASYQLHDAPDRSAVLAAIREILVNLVGSEEFAIFELGRDGSSLVLADWCGIDPAAFEKTQAAARIGQMASGGDALATPTRSAGGEPTVLACVPLTAVGRVTGAIAIFGLLPHKPRLEPTDQEMFDLLASQAGTALYCTTLHQAALGRQSETT